MTLSADKKATSKMVASMAGVSVATVSRVVNDGPNVKDNTRNKVMLVIKLLNYQPNEAAQQMARARFKM